jgi:hypothetical protein
MASVSLHSYILRLLQLFVALFVGGNCEFNQKEFHLAMQCAADVLPLSGVLGTSYPVSRSRCAAMCSSKAACVSFDLCKDGTCRLRCTHLTTTCAGGSPDCDHYDWRGKTYNDTIRSYIVYVSAVHQYNIHAYWFSLKYILISSR